MVKVKTKNDRKWEVHSLSEMYQPASGQKKVERLNRKAFNVAHYQVQGKVNGHCNSMENGYSKITYSTDVLIFSTVFQYKTAYTLIFYLSCTILTTHSDMT